LIEFVRHRNVAKVTTRHRLKGTARTLGCSFIIDPVLQ